MIYKTLLGAPISQETPVSVLDFSMKSNYEKMHVSVLLEFRLSYFSPCVLCRCVRVTTHQCMCSSVYFAFIRHTPFWQRF